MQLFLKWIPGRQEGAIYSKALIYRFRLFKFGFDCYVLKYPPTTSLPLHVDKVSSGKHWRMNITLCGSSIFYRELNSEEMQCSCKRINIFRPDIQKHMLTVGGRGCVKLSSGFVKYY